MLSQGVLRRDIGEKMITNESVDYLKTPALYSLSYAFFFIVIVTWRRAVVIGLKICKFKHPFNNVITFGRSLFNYSSSLFC